MRYQEQSIQLDLTYQAPYNYDYDRRFFSFVRYSTVVQCSTLQHLGISTISFEPPLLPPLPLPCNTILYRPAHALSHLLLEKLINLTCQKQGRVVSVLPRHPKEQREYAHAHVRSYTSCATPKPTTVGSRCLARAPAGIYRRRLCEEPRGCSVIARRGRKCAELLTY